MNNHLERDKELQVQAPVKQNLLQTKKNRSDTAADQINVEFYTDPLCCWSWAFEKHWRRFVESHDNIRYRYIICGMIPDWKTYNDPMNSVTKPIQMGPVWMHASEVTGVKMKYSLWHEDPPSSSYPSCIAVKTAGLQSAAAENELLFLLRAALMEEGKNISKPEIILDIATRVEADDFDLKKFKHDWASGEGKESFRRDLQQAKFHNIGRYPTLTFTRNSSSDGIMIVGYRPYEALQQAYNLFTSNPSSGSRTESQTIKF